MPVHEAQTKQSLASCRIFVGPAEADWVSLLARHVYGTTLGAVRYAWHRTVRTVAIAHRAAMLHEFVTSNRNELINRCREKAAKRSPHVSAGGDHGVPLFLEQLADILRIEQLTPNRNVEEPEPTPTPTEIGRTAALHGADLLRLGFSIDQVVHGYGDVCQAVTGLAVEQEALIDADEFRTLNRCLDNAIADAVTAFGRVRQNSINDHADELRRLVDIATHAYFALKSGNVGLTGATGTLLLHSLTELRALADRSQPEIRQAPATITLRPKKAASH